MFDVLRLYPGQRAERDPLHWLHGLADRRIWQHKTEDIPGFTSKYGVKLLVWYEAFSSRETAFRRERQMKKWYRAWKIELIERFNPDWRDLYEDLNR